MGNHGRGQENDNGPTSTANTSDEYIGRHRDRTEVREQGSGWAIGRGVDPRNVVDHTRNA